MEYAINIKRWLFSNMLKGGQSIGLSFGALVALHKDSSVSEHPELTVQLWGLYGSGFSHI
jgi:hypothetical protein